MNKEEKEIFLKEIKKYKGDIPIMLDSNWTHSLYNLLKDEKSRKKVLIENIYGLLGNLLDKYKDNLDDDLLKKIYLKDLKNYRVNLELIPVEKKY